MFATAMATKPSANRSALRRWPVSAAICVGQFGEFRRHDRAVDRLVASRPNRLGKCAGTSLPSMTLQSVTVSVPPRR
jgi:hypothetical protein